LHMGAKFGKENGAYLYFVYRIKGNLRWPQLVSTESQVWIFLKIPGTVVNIRTIKHFRFKLMSVCSLCRSFQNVNFQEHTFYVNEKQKRMYFALYIKCPSS
jgi:hypothetical protein